MDKILTLTALTGYGEETVVTLANRCVYHLVVPVELDLIGVGGDKLYHQLSVLLGNEIPGLPQAIGGVSAWLADNQVALLGHVGRTECRWENRAVVPTDTYECAISAGSIVDFNT